MIKQQHCIAATSAPVYMPQYTQQYARQASNVMCLHLGENAPFVHCALYKCDTNTTSAAAALCVHALCVPKRTMCYTVIPIPLSVISMINHLSKQQVLEAVLAPFVLYFAVSSLVLAGFSLAAPPVQAP
jgi:hypothetical protein